MNDEQFRQRGGVVLWLFEVYGDELPEEIRKRFPEAQQEPILEIPIRGQERMAQIAWVSLRPRMQVNQR
jgi:hypothetical protein